MPEISESTTLKQCFSCKRFFPANRQYFYRHRQHKDGLVHLCIPCERVRAKKWREENRAYCTEKSRQYYAGRDKDAHRIYGREQMRRLLANPEYRARVNRLRRLHRKNNPEQTRADNKRYHRLYATKAARRARTYHRLHREQIYMKHKKWLLEHPERAAAYQHQCYARHKTADAGDFNAFMWQAILLIYRHRCYYCGAKPKVLTVDHIQALSRDGLHTSTNIVPACRSCNSRKGNRPAPIPVQPILPLRFT